MEKLREASPPSSSLSSVTDKSSDTKSETLSCPSSSSGNSTQESQQKPIEGGSTTITGNSPDNNTSAETLFYNPPRSKYTPLAFEDPIEMLFWLDDNIAEGHIKLHDWQTEELLRICRGGYTKEHFLKYFLCACNGSGKDAYINAVIAIFLTVTKIRHRCILTSSSYKQLSTQTEAYIRNMAFQLNTKMEEEGIPNFFSVKNGFIVCNETGSEIKMFVTDDAGKAEGDHPYADYPGAEMCIILNEAKSINPDIFFALARCTGYNRWIEVSSPGIDDGDFYRHCTSDHTIQYPLPQEQDKAYFRRVSCYECSHITKQEIKLAQRDLLPIQFRSIYLAEFTSLNEQVMIKAEDLNNLWEYKVEWVQDGFKTGGLDLSLGGDETVLVTRDGNKALTVDAVRIGESPNLEIYLDSLMSRRGLQKNSSKIFTDVGGLGKPIAQHLIKMGWRIIGVLNNEQAHNLKLYANRGAEDWQRVADIIVRKHILFSDECRNNKTLIHQLSHRYYKFNDDIKIKLEMKKDAKAEGRKSPDRADAFILAFVDFHYTKAITIEVKPRLTQEDFLKEMDKIRFTGITAEQVRQMQNTPNNKVNRHNITTLLAKFVTERKN